MILPSGDARAGVPAPAPATAVADAGLHAVVQKRQPGELALFGGKPLFAWPRSTSNLVPPDPDAFLTYSREFFDQRRYTNDGPLVRRLEARLAQFHEARFCITFCSGFWALAMAMKCLARDGANEVVMPSLTYRRMADVAAWAGLQPHFCEVDPRTLAVSAETARACISEKTALLLGVHPIVNCCDVDGLLDLGRERGLPVLFDSVESMYESYHGRKIGSFGAAEAFSLHASKLVNGFEGGYITTNDERLAARLMRMRAFGFYGQDNIEELGMNAKLNEIHAAMALAGLDGLEQQVDRNRQCYRQYQSLLADLPGVRLVEFDETERCSFKNIMVELRDPWRYSRDATVILLNAERILARAYYSPPLHRKTYAYPAIVHELPVSDNLAQRFLLLPCGHFVSDDDTAQVVTLLHFLQDNASVVLERMGKAAGAGGGN
jgi:dTDP-4-amino-4,6-dideoxygalactose transaminase